MESKSTFQYKSNVDVPIGIDPSTLTGSGDYAQFQITAKGYLYVYYAFDVPELPDGAVIDKVSGNAFVSTNSTSNVTDRLLYICSGTTKKSNGTTWSAKKNYAIQSEETWTIDELKNCSFLGQLRYTGTGQVRSYRLYGAKLTVTYTYQSEKFMIKSGGAWNEVAKTYKKINGVWVEQTELSSVMDANTKYRKG